MATKARKFKKRLALKTKKSQQQPVFSISLIRKGSIKKFGIFWKHLVSKVKSFKIQPLTK